ncbi:MAG: flagellar biosynthesis anti-sigma factor FlgM [Myxococcales bacterium]|nr:flagellar biosynthesis anti-sigma factor FlgM [Myxococcales bacterium]
MRIDPTTITPITDAERRPGPTSTRASGQPASVVALGPEASAAGTGGVTPEISARVGRVRELLAKGEYVVDLDRLAANILDDDLAREGER